jgi:primase-polymerase (primpol)-like protein
MFPPKVKIGGQCSTGRPAATAEQAPQSISLDDRALIDRARSADDGGKFARLWAGDWSSYGSPSDADEALCFKLAFWTDRDAPRMDSLFRQSGLYRPKWDQRHYGNGRTYGQGTIDQAIATVREVYRPGSAIIGACRIVQRPDGSCVRRLPPIRRPRGVPASPSQREVAR